ncbi:MAG: hypothetical protein ACHQ50_12450 [Fimbriimonadales bacterium]
MVELVVRLCISLAILGLGALGFVPFDVAWKAAVALAGVSLFGWRVESKGLMNGGVAGFFAIAEAFTLAIVLAASGVLHELGFLVLIPCIYAGARFSSPMNSMAPLAASCLVGADCLYSKAGLPSPAVLFHAAGVLAVSLLLGHRTPTTSHTNVIEEHNPHPAPQLVEDGLLQLRESFRKLRDAYSELERRSRKDKITARISKARMEEGEKFYSELCMALRELTRAEDLAVYSLAQFEQVMVVRSVTQDYPGDLRDRSIDIDVSKAPVVVREQAEAAIASLGAGTSIVNMLLIHKGKIVGMVCAIEPHPMKREEIRKNLAEVAPVAATAVGTEMEREARTCRAKELELLYEISSVSSGATTPAILAGRVSREVKQMLHLDSVRIVLLRGGKEKVISNEGSRARLVDAMTFARGSGVHGWIASGAPELFLFDVRQDPRCNREETLKRRIGSFGLIPLWIGPQVAGYIGAATQLIGGIDLDQMGTLRLVGAELSRALERFAGKQPGGIMTPQEFTQFTTRREGSLVYLEPLRREQTIAVHGFAAFEEAIRRLTHQLRAMVPSGGSVCRRDQGDFLVFLESDEEFARTWANEVAASASFIAISSSDPSKRIPLALRARVARLTTQTNQLSVEIPA